MRRPKKWARPMGQFGQPTAKLWNSPKIRNNLFHEGESRDLKVEEYLPFLREFVAALLKVLFREAAEAKLATQIKIVRRGFILSGSAI
jgi:hypothetical protein